MRNWNWKRQTFYQAGALLMTWLPSSPSTGLATSLQETAVYATEYGLDGIPNPRKIRTAGDWLAANYLWGRLVRFGEIGAESGDLAKSWIRSRNGLHWVFELYPNAKWSDGSPMSAKDVVASLKESLFGTVHTQLSAYVTEIKAEGDSKIVFNLSQLPENFLFSLSCPDFAITDTNKDTTRYSGPYRLLTANADSLHFEWNEHYAGPRSPSAPKKISLVDTRGIDDSLSKLAAGEIQILSLISDVVTTEQNARIKTLPDLQDLNSSPDWTIALSFGKRGLARFSSAERRWLYRELWRKFAQGSDFGAGPATGIRPPTKFGGVSPKEFLTWLDELEVSKPEPKNMDVEWFMMERHYRSPFVSVIAKALKDLGFNVTLVPTGPDSTEDIRSRNRSRDYDFGLRFEGVADPDPDSAWRYMMEYYPGDKSPVTSAELDAAMLKRDKLKRSKMYKDFEKRVLQDPFTIFLRLSSSRILIRKPLLPPKEGQFEWGVQLWMFRHE